MRNTIISLNVLISTALFLAFMMPALAFAQSSASAQGIGGGTALNWSGYVSDTGTYTSVSGSWVVPTVTAISENGADATWVGIGGVLSHDLIQIGTEAVPDSSSGIDYQAWYELLPSGSVTVPLAVHPGDSITASVTEESGASDTWLISIDDTTTGNSYSTTVHYASSLSSAEWIEEMPAGVGERISLDDFGTVDFTDGMTTEDGSTVSIAGSNAQSLTMANDQDQPLAVPSVINADGESFSVTRTDAASSAIGIGGFDGRGGFMTAGYGSYGAAGTTTQITPNVSVSYGYGGGYGMHPHYRMRMNRSYSYVTQNDDGTIRIIIDGYSRF